MKTTKEQSRKYLEIIATQKENIHRHEEEIQKSLGVCVLRDVGVFKTMWVFLDRYIDLVSEKTGIDIQSLSWFVHQNDCGKNMKLLFGRTGQEKRVIDSISAFLDLQYEQQNEEKTEFNSGSKEHDDLLCQFEKEYKLLRSDRDEVSVRKFGYYYKDGEFSKLFLAYRKGYILGKFVSL